MRNAAYVVGTSSLCVYTKDNIVRAVFPLSEEWTLRVLPVENSGIFLDEEVQLGTFMYKPNLVPLDDNYYACQFFSNFSRSVVELVSRVRD